MIMYSLHPTQDFPPTNVSAQEAMECINAMVLDGVIVHNATFLSQDGQQVIVFWSVDGSGTVATVWEYLFSFVPFGAFPEPIVNVMERQAVYDTQDNIRRIEGGSADRDAYAVGE